MGGGPPGQRPRDHCHRRMGKLSEELDHKKFKNGSPSLEPSGLTAKYRYPFIRYPLPDPASVLIPRLLILLIVIPWQESQLECRGIKIKITPGLSAKCSSTNLDPPPPKRSKQLPDEAPAYPGTPGPGYPGTRPGVPG
eukprot:3481520-Rhodomonas_salina.4